MTPTINNSLMLMNLISFSLSPSPSLTLSLSLPSLPPILCFSHLLSLFIDIHVISWCGYLLFVLLEELSFLILLNCGSHYGKKSTKLVCIKFAIDILLPKCFYPYN